MDHKNFHFTSFSDKTNDEIFFKSLKTLSLGLFWPFLVIFARWEIFLKKSRSVTHNHIWVSNTMPSFRKKLMYQLREKSWTDGRTDGWKDRRPDQHLNNGKGAINIKTKSFVSQKRHVLKTVTIYMIQSVSFLVRFNKNESMIQLFYIFLFNDIWINQQDTFAKPVKNAR